MSIKGRPGTWFENAVRRGDLGAALSEASELPRPLPPLHALGLVMLLGEASDPRHGRWAARWAAQLTLAQPTVDLAVLGELVDALEAAAASDRSGRRALAALAAAHGVRRADALLPAPRRR